ncbi:MAG: type II toxin-antitoxin system VapB family antitoxin [Acidimicrobiaceae bacterium]|nr:type II toxin-antitoxin system VapB family antitoxin [Acidimicrobiaceae bacterium]MDE0607512.1 type II toxin-antitoxin system VapB family antitoxin [Acidimicrobiaceae bacterium]
MTKRLIDIDDDILAEARAVTGAATMKETINIALRHIVETELRLRHVKRLQDLDGMDLADSQIMAAAWR